MGDAPRENQIDRRREEVAVLQKERTFFGKENLEALVDRDLGLVRFNLAEVGIHRCIQYKAPMQDEFSIQPNVGFESAALENRMVRITLVDIAKAAKQSVRNQLNVPPGRDVLHATGIGGLVEAPLNAVGNSWPENIFISAGNATVQDDAPLLPVGLGETQALKWNGDERKVPAPGKASFGAP